MGGPERRRSSVVNVQRADDGVLRLDDAAVRKMSQVNSRIVDDFEDAKRAAENEHNLSVRDAIKLYPKAICFSLIFSTAVIVSVLMSSMPLAHMLTIVQDGRL